MYGEGGLTWGLGMLVHPPHRPIGGEFHSEFHLLRLEGTLRGGSEAEAPDEVILTGVV